MKLAGVIRGSIRGTTHKRRAAGIVLGLALGAVSLQSCGDKDSLVLVSLTASPANEKLTTVAISVGAVTRTFPLTAGLSATPVQFGVYVSSSVTGTDLLVAATAHVGASAGCYQGTSMDTTITAAGQTVMTSIELAQAKGCASTTGAAGTSGAAGTTGSAGTSGSAGASGTAGTTGSAGTTGMAGTSGTAGTTGTAGTSGSAGTTGMAGSMGTAGMIQIVAAPTLSKCTEYSHIDALSCNGNSASANVSLWDVAISPNGAMLATAGKDGRVKIWKLTGAVPTASGHVITTSGQAYVAFSPDSSLLVVGDDVGTMNLYETTNFTSMRALTGHNDVIEGVTFTSDGKEIWSVDHGGVMTRHDTAVGTAPSASVPLGGFGYAIAVSPVATTDVQYLGVGYDDGTADVANVGITMPTPTNITVSGDGFGVYTMNFSPDGKTMIAGGSDGALGFWTIPGVTASGTPITILDADGFAMSVNTARYSPDGRSIAIAAGDGFSAWTFGIWDATTRAKKVTKVPTWTPLSVAWSPSQGILVTGEDTCGKFMVCSDN